MFSLVPSRPGGRAPESDLEALDRSPVAEAREALAYWRGRAGRLPWYRWEARREARVMAARWRERLLRARLEHAGLRALGPALAPLARGRRAHAAMIARWLVRPQGLVRRALFMVAGTVIVAFATFALMGVLAVHLLGQIV
jgi:hypothetical protein